MIKGGSEQMAMWAELFLVPYAPSTKKEGDPWATFLISDNYTTLCCK